MMDDDESELDDNVVVVDVADLARRELEEVDRG